MQYKTQARLQVRNHIRGSDSSKSLLTRCVPYLQFDFLSVHVNRPYLKIHANRCDVGTCGEKYAMEISSTRPGINIESQTLSLSLKQGDYQQPVSNIVMVGTSNDLLNVTQHIY